MTVGSLGRLADIAIIAGSGLCASCVPLSLQYYVPSAEGSKVVSYSCTGNPPFEASFVDGGVPRKYAMRVGLSQKAFKGAKEEPTITLMIDPFYPTLVHVDPTLIRIEADGQAVPLKPILYYMGKSGSAPILRSDGLIHVETDYLLIHLPLGISGPQNVVIHFPAIRLGEKLVALPDVSFKLERHRILYNLAINC